MSTTAQYDPYENAIAKSIERTLRYEYKHQKHILKKK